MPFKFWFCLLLCCPILGAASALAQETAETPKSQSETTLKRKLERNLDKMAENSVVVFDKDGNELKNASA